jgi:hypothetical protein
MKYLPELAALRTGLSASKPGLGPLREKSTLWNSRLAVRTGRTIETAATVARIVGRWKNSGSNAQSAVLPSFAADHDYDLGHCLGIDFHQQKAA